MQIQYTVLCCTTVIKNVHTNEISPLRGFILVVYIPRLNLLPVLFGQSIAKLHRGRLNVCSEEVPNTDFGILSLIPASNPWEAFSTSYGPFKFRVHMELVERSLKRNLCYSNNFFLYNIAFSMVGLKQQNPKCLLNIQWEAAIFAH